MKAVRQRSAREGFSLLEVLVASAILGIVMMVLLSTLTTSLSLWRNTESKSMADREGRAAELLLAQDLASVVVPAEPKLWPRVVGTGDDAVLQFLTLKPADYQEAGDVGDVCFVEYRVAADDGELQRSFLGSADTYITILKEAGEFPVPGQAGIPQLLAGNLLADNRDAVRGSPGLKTEINTDYFTMLDTTLVPLAGSYTMANRPVAIEVNFAATDSDTLRNTDLLSNPDYILRNAGLYSTRFYLPKPPNAP